MKVVNRLLFTFLIGCLTAFLGGCLSFDAADSVCPDCKGEANRSVCGICWGEGLRADGQKERLDRCPTCLGTGQNQTMYRPPLSEALARFASICPSCAGRGEKKVVSPLLVHCKRCNGTGKGSVRVFCQRCEGTGEKRGIFRRGKNRKGWVPVPSAIVLPEGR